MPKYNIGDVFKDGTGSEATITDWRPGAHTNEFLYDVDFGSGTKASGLDENQFEFWLQNRGFQYIPVKRNHAPTPKYELLDELHPKSSVSHTLVITARTLNTYGEYIYDLAMAGGGTLHVDIEENVIDHWIATIGYTHINRHNHTQPTSNPWTNGAQAVSASVPVVPQNAQYVGRLVEVCKCESRDLFNYGCRCGYTLSKRV